MFEGPRHSTSIACSNAWASSPSGTGTLVVTYPTFSALRCP
jgi:hypothetical protein